MKVFLIACIILLSSCTLEKNRTEQVKHSGPPLLPDEPKDMK